MSRTVPQSVRLLELACRRWMLEKKGREPWFRDISLPELPRPRARIVDLVLFGDFFRQLCGIPRWPSGRYRIWTISRASRDVAVELFGLPSECVSTIPRYELFPVTGDPPRFPPAGEPWTLLYSGRISMLKNFDLCLRVASLLQITFNEKVRLVCFGQFDNTPATGFGRGAFRSYRNHVEKLCSELKWKQAPIFHGEVGHDEWHRAALRNPVLFSLSKFPMEDFGVSIAQAQTRGWPCILSDWGGYRDVQGPAVIRVPAFLLGSADDPEPVEQGHAFSVAREIAIELLRKRKLGGPRQVSLETPLPVKDPEPLSHRELLKVHRDFQQRFPEDTQPGNRLFNRVHRDPAQHLLFRKYNAIFSSRELKPRKTLVLTATPPAQLRKKTMIAVAEMAWAAAAGREHEIEVIRVGSIAHALRLSDTLLQAHEIVFTERNPAAEELIRFLRLSLSIEVPITILDYENGRRKRSPR